jgi:glucosyl-3-phosphoglycerate synthase
MNRKYANHSFRRILVPLMWDCTPEDTLQAALAIGGRQAVRLAGFVRVDPELSLSMGALHAQMARRRLRELSEAVKTRGRSRVTVSYSPLDELRGVLQHDNPDLLMLGWPDDFKAMGASLEEVLNTLQCDLSIVRGPLPSRLRRILVAIRGGSNAELALRVALAIARESQAQLSSLNITSAPGLVQPELPFRGLARVLENLPEIEKLRIYSDDPASTILERAVDFDLVIAGAGALQADGPPGLGNVAARLLEECPTATIIVKSRRAKPGEALQASVGQSAISVLVDRWFAENTYHADEFADLEELLRLKRRQNVTISLALPALNEADTVGNVIQTIKGPLMDEVPILDEIVLIDSNSTDETRAIAGSLGVPVYIHQETLPRYGARRGKGEALWKSLYLTRGDIILWIDTDIVNIHPRFIYGLVGPLLANPAVKFVKGFYRRPIKVGERIQAGGGGRVTELTARPLLNLFFPELSGVIQPLSGEYGGRRALLERLPFASGYGVEIGLLIDVLKNAGLSAIAQVDLQERIHHNQPIEALSKMSFEIIQTVMGKLETYEGLCLLDDANRSLKLIRYGSGRLYLDVEEIIELDRPPMIQIKEYRERSLS